MFKNEVLVKFDKNEKYELESEYIDFVFLKSKDSEGEVTYKVIEKAKTGEVLYESDSSLEDLESLFYKLKEEEMLHKNSF